MQAFFCQSHMLNSNSKLNSNFHWQVMRYVRKVHLQGLEDTQVSFWRDEGPFIYQASYYDPHTDIVLIFE